MAGTEFRDPQKIRVVWTVEEDRAKD